MIPLKTVQSLCKHHIKSPALSIAKQVLNAGAIVEACAGNAEIGVGCDFLLALGLNDQAQGCQLILGRALVQKLGGIASVKAYTQRRTSGSDERVVADTRLEAMRARADIRG